MFSVKEIADLLGVSMVTVYNHLKKNRQELKGHITKQKGVIYVKEEGLNILKVSLGIIQPPTTNKYANIQDMAKDISDIVIQEVGQEISEQLKEDNKQNFEALKEQIEELKKQNNLLIEIVQDKNSNIISKLKGLFNKEK